MMSQQSCAEKAQICEDRAVNAFDAAHGADWLEMATQWRELARDVNRQATLARLMNMDRIARSPLIANAL
jgi:hypothetical protein